MFAASSSLAANLLLDPGLEESTGGSQTNPFWTLDVNMPDGVGTSAQFQNAPWASNPAGEPGTGLWLKAFEGQQDAGDSFALATLSQSVTGSAGASYEMKAYVRVETNYTAAGTILAVDFLQGGTVLSSEELDVGPLHPKDGSWQEFSVSATSPEGTDTVRVRAQMIDGTVAAENPQSAMIDDFSLEVSGGVVPEPSTALLATLGLGAMLVRRRRS